MIDLTISTTFEPAVKNCTARSDYFALLAILLQMPSAEVIEGIKKGIILDDFQSIAQELDFPDRDTREISEKLMQVQHDLNAQPGAFAEVRQEYTRLFAHPKSPEIYLFEGLFIDSEKIKKGEVSSDARLFINPAATDAERHYQQAGLACVTDVRMPADSITTELEFMSFLCKNLAEAVLEGESTVEIREQIDAFTSQHIMKWVPRFFERCIEKSRISFYSAVGFMGCRLVVASSSIPKKL